jgi:hypothetical protein
MLQKLGVFSLAHAFSRIALTIVTADMPPFTDDPRASVLLRSAAT